MKTRSIGVLPLPLLFVPLAAAAVPGALEINQDCIAVGCFAGDTAGYPVTITQPGTYVLTSDLAAPDGSKDAIEVTASAPVDLDLGGHTIDGGGSCTGTPVTNCSGATGGTGVFLQGATPTSWHVHDGTIRGFVNAISLFFAEDGTVFERLTLTQNSNVGAYVNSAASGSVRIRDSQIERNGNQGVFVTSAVAYVENTSVVGNHADGIDFYTSGSVAVGNRIASNGTKGLYCGETSETCALGQNTFAGNNGGGAAAQFTVTALSDMGGNVCLDHASGACP